MSLAADWEMNFQVHRKTSQEVMAAVRQGMVRALDLGLGPKRQNVQNRTGSGNPHQKEEQIVTGKGRQSVHFFARLILRWGQ